MLFGLILGVVAILVMMVIMNDTSNLGQTGKYQAKAIHLSQSITNLQSLALYENFDYINLKNQIKMNKHVKEIDVLKTEYDVAFDDYDVLAYEIDDLDLIMTIYLYQDIIELDIINKKDYVFDKQFKNLIKQQLTKLGE